MTLALVTRLAAYAISEADHQQLTPQQLAAILRELTVELDGKEPTSHA